MSLMFLYACLYVRMYVGMYEPDAPYQEKEWCSGNYGVVTHHVRGGNEHMHHVHAMFVCRTMQ